MYQCITWNSGKYLYQNTCRSVWPDGYFANSTSNECQGRSHYHSNLLACDESCSTCTGPTNSDCINWNSSINNTYYKHLGDWLRYCPSGFFGDNTTQIWSSCHTYCTEWYGYKSTECTAWDISNRYYYAIPDTCQYMFCFGSTYYNTSKYQCENCDSTCLTCTGPTADNCTSCAYSLFLVNSTNCLTCEAKTPGTYFHSDTGNWEEVCGKGFNLGGVQCDDGNKVNDDGWSEYWKVEVDWMCSGGNSTHPDNWENLHGPICTAPKHISQ